MMNPDSLVFLEQPRYELCLYPYDNYLTTLPFWNNEIENFEVYPFFEIKSNFEWRQYQKRIVMQL